MGATLLVMVISSVLSDIQHHHRRFPRLNYLVMLTGNGYILLYAPGAQLISFKYLWSTSVELPLTVLLFFLPPKIIYIFLYA